MNSKPPSVWDVIGCTAIVVLVILSVILLTLFIGGCAQRKPPTSQQYTYHYAPGDFVASNLVSMTVLEKLPPENWSGPRYKCLIKENGNEAFIGVVQEVDLKDAMEKGTLNGSRVTWPDLKKLKEKALRRF
jgi:hypothetical protein